MAKYEFDLTEFSARDYLAILLYGAAARPRETGLSEFVVPASEKAQLAFGLEMMEMAGRFSVTPIGSVPGSDTIEWLGDFAAAVVEHINKKTRGPEPPCASS